MQNAIEKKDGFVIFTGHGVAVFQALAIKNALQFYAKHKMPINRAYTPARMLRTASSMTGRQYKRGEYLKAAEDLQALVEGVRQ